MIQPRFIFSLLTLLLIMCSCNPDDGGTPGEPDDPTVDMSGSTWEIIHEKIITPNCVSCHTAGSTFANQSDLVLTSDVAYANLIDVDPKNAAANADGLKRLGTNGFSSLFYSFFWEKINAPNQEHFYADHPSYGEIMPIGSDPLTNGELEFIKQWILKGAPEVGLVADTTLLEDTTRFVAPPDDWQPLPLPSSGVQMHLGPFNVIANHERELYSYQAVGNSEDLYVDNVEIRMRGGSHHFILYDFPNGTNPPPVNIIRDIRDENGNDVFATYLSISNQRFIFGTQFRNTNYQYPPGVALKIPAGKFFDMNSHYTNYGSDDMTGEIYVNLNTVPQSEVQHLAEELFLNKTNFYLPPQQVSTLNATYTFPDRRNIFMLTAHGHKHMEEFSIYIKGGSRDGELVYFTNDWEHPELFNYDPPLTLNPGEGLRGEAIYNNDTDQGLSFGLLSTDEMMIIFGAYYVD